MNKELRSVTAQEWLRRCERLQNPLLRGKVVGLVLWDFGSYMLASERAVLAEYLRSHRPPTGTRFSDRQMQSALRLIGYSNYWARVRGKNPVSYLSDDVEHVSHTRRAIFKYGYRAPQEKIADPEPFAVHLPFKGMEE